MSSSPFRKDLLVIAATALMALLLVPLLAYLFTQHAIADLDGRYLASIERSIDEDSRLSPQDKLARKEGFRTLPPSLVCTVPDAEVARYRAAVCEPYSTLWQFVMARKVAGWALVSGLALLAIVIALGALAFVNRRMQYLSFVTGWRLLTFASAAEVIVQGALAVWLS